MPLSDAACRAAKPREKAYKMADFHGLYMQITPHGSKLWRMKYRYCGKEKLLSIGPYPEVTLAEAREARDKARKLLASGEDPSLVKQDKKRLQIANAANTFEAVALEWHQKNEVRWSENHAATVLRRLKIDLFKSMGNVPIAQIDTPRLAQAIQDIEKRGAYVVARRALQYARAVFAYAKIQGKVQHNPADIKASDFLAPVKSGHYAAMDAKEIPAFISKLRRNDARLFRPTQLAMELMMLTFVRTGELIKAQWEEFDFEKKVWLLPASRMKMKRDHIVPLSRQALEILDELKTLHGHRPYVFPGQRDPRGHMSNGAILMALRRMGYGDVHTGHGFRALAMTTLMEELGYAHEIPDMQLAHSKGDDIRRAYDRTKFLDQRKEMMQEWADYLDNVANGIVITAKFQRK